MVFVLPEQNMQQTIKIQTKSPSEYGEKIFTKQLDSDLSLKNTLIEEILSILKTRSLLEEEEETWARLCLDEVIVNAIVHGNKEDKSKKVEVSLFVDNHLWAVRIEDEGEGFSEEILPNTEGDEYWDSEHGRGIMLLQDYMDEVWYYDKGNRVQLTKKKKTKWEKIVQKILFFFRLKD